MKALCKRCGVEKDVTEFRKHHSAGPYELWNVRDCKSCVHKDYVERRANPDVYKALTEASKAWKQRNKERHAELAREFRLRHPEQIIAQNRLNYAIRKGRVTRGPCEVCGTTERVQAHHVSYKPEDWYNVRWLCFKCHKFEHAPPEYLNK